MSRLKLLDGAEERLMGGCDSSTELGTDAPSKPRGTQTANQFSGVLLTPDSVEGLVLEREREKRSSPRLLKEALWELVSEHAWIASQEQPTDDHFLTCCVTHHKHACAYRRGWYSRRSR